MSCMPSSQDGLSELVSDPVSRGRNSSGMPDGMLISKYLYPCAFVQLFLCGTCAAIVDSSHSMRRGSVYEVFVRLVTKGIRGNGAGRLIVITDHCHN